MPFEFDGSLSTVVEANQVPHVAPEHATGPLSPELLNKMHRYWCAANYLTVGHIYLQENPLLREPLSRDHIKKRLLGHWGTSPGINFIYTHCKKACPPIMANLVKVQKLLPDRIGTNIFMYSITLKPHEDGPRELKEYASNFGIGPGWRLLTGKPADVELLRASLGFKYRDPAEDADKSNHIGMIRLGNEPYLRWAACPGQAAPAWIAKSILLEMDGPTRPPLVSG